MSNVVSGMPGSVFILGQLVVFIFLGLIVPFFWFSRTFNANYGATCSLSGYYGDIVVSAYNW